MSTSLPQQLSDTTLDSIVSHFGLTERHAAEGGPYMVLSSQLPMVQGPVGFVRVFHGDPLAMLVTCSIVVPAMQLDSHMIFAFTQSHSAVPHFTLDSVKAGDHYSFHLDLIPRVDLAEHTGYMNQVFKPLSGVYQQAEAIEGLAPAHVSPIQRATMSPWMLVHRANETAFSQIGHYVQQYLQHWQKLVADTVASPVSESSLQQRDKANRAAIFSTEIDPVWHRIDGLIGLASGQQLRALLQGNTL